MRAWAVVECGKPLQEIELPTPEPEGDQVVLEVTHAGVCHSDIHIWEGEYDLGARGKLRMTDRGMKLPLAMGHEIVGRVAKWGPGAEGKVKAGDVRLVFPWVGCGQCAACRRDEENMCPRGQSLGVYRNGGYATHVLALHWKHLVPIDGLDPALAATYACSGVTVFSAARKIMPLEPDEAVVLVGAGGLGLQAISVLKAMGHRRIVSVDVDPTKLEAAKAIGATETVLADDDGPATTSRIVEASGGLVAAVIDLVNGTKSAAFAFDALRKGGKLVQVGLFGGEMRVPLPLMPIKAITLQGSYVGDVKELRELVGLAQQGKIPPIPVATQPLATADQALNRLRSGQVTGRIVLTAG
jgi:alcohol dehydrogenase/propanol-preferring alcohol dehydrogenase